MMKVVVIAGGGREDAHAPDCFARLADGTGVVIDIPGRVSSARIRRGQALRSGTPDPLLRGRAPENTAHRGKHQPRRPAGRLEKWDKQEQACPPAQGAQMLHLSAIHRKAPAVAAGGLIVVTAVAACASNGPQATTARTPHTAGTSSAASASPAGTSPAGSATRTAPATGHTGPNVTRCTAATLTLAEGNHFGAGGHVFTAYVFTNVGTTTCELHGYPGLQFVGHDGKPVPTTERRSAAYTFPAVQPRTVLLHRGAKASFSLEVLDNPQTGKGETACPTATAVKVIPPDGYQQLSAPFGPSPVCGFGTVTVSPVVPGDQGVTYHSAAG